MQVDTRALTAAGRVEYVLLFDGAATTAHRETIDTGTRAQSKLLAVDPSLLDYGVGSRVRIDEHRDTERTLLSADTRIGNFE
jgi:hypothetical protein